MAQSENGDWEPVQWKFFSQINKFSVHFVIEDHRFDGRQHILSHLAHLFDSRIMADVKFLVKDEEIGAHLAIVVSASPVMAAMLEPDKFKEGLTKTVHIDDMEPDVFKEMLRYLYTGAVPQLEQNGEPLFVAADRFQIQGLKELCTEQLIQQLHLNNAVRYLLLGHLHSVPRLLEASFEYLERNKDELWTRSDWKKLGESYPDLFYQATGRMMKRERCNKRERGIATWFKMLK
jgi:speckle-type POZ protein